MIAVNANKNIDNYKKEFIAGFSLKEALSVFLGIVVGVIVITLLIMAGLPVMMCPYIAIPFIALPIVPKFYRKNNMSLGNNRKKMAEIKKGVILKSVSTENRAYYESFLEMETAKEKQEDIFKKKMKKLLIAGAVFITVLVAVIVTVVIIKLKM